MARQRVVWLAGAVTVAALVVLALCTGERTSGTGVTITYRLEGGSGHRDVERVLEVIRRRLDRADQVVPGVRRREDDVIVELAGDRFAIAKAKLLIASQRTLGFHVIDDGAEFWTRTYELATTDRRPPGIDVHAESWPEVGDVPARAGRRDRYLRAADRDVLTGYLAQLHRDPVLAPPSDRRVAYEQLFEAAKPGWRTQVIVRDPALTGASITRADVVDEQGRSTVRLELDAAGRETFATLTAAHVGDKIAIVLDGVVHSAPVVTSAIKGGQVSITMGGRGDPAQQRAEAHELAAVLGAGALPAPLAVIDERPFEFEIGDGVRWNVLAILGLAAVGFAVWMMARRRS